MENYATGNPAAQFLAMAPTPYRADHVTPEAAKCAKVEGIWGAGALERRGSRLHYQTPVERSSMGQTSANH